MLLDENAPGNQNQARRLLTEAVERYRTIGMPRHLGLAEDLLAEAGR